MMKTEERPATKWKLFECSGGARWASAHQDYTGEICSFSGCGCGSRVRYVQTVEDRQEVHSWFTLPIKKGGAS